MICYNISIKIKSLQHFIKHGIVQVLFIEKSIGLFSFLDKFQIFCLEFN